MHQQHVPRMPQQTFKPWTAPCLPTVPPPPPVTPVRQAQKTIWPDSEARQLTILQLNCNYLPAKVRNLTKLARMQAAHLIILQEAKLGCGVPTPPIPGYEGLSLDRQGRGSTLRRGGVLTVYIQDNIPYHLMGTPTSGSIEVQSPLD